MRLPELHYTFTRTGLLTTLATAVTLITAHSGVFNEIPHGKEIVAVAAGLGSVLSAFGITASGGHAPAPDAGGAGATGMPASAAT